MSLLDFYNHHIAPLAEELDKALERRQPKYIRVRHVPSHNFNVVIPFKNRTQIVFLDDEQVHDILAFDYETGVLGEQAFDPGEAPF